jgi:hypothetical protein
MQNMFRESGIKKIDEKEVDEDDVEDPSLQKIREYYLEGQPEVNILFPTKVNNPYL